jgi:hypothetical protein
VSTITKILPSYLFQQYRDDEALQEFVDAYNDYAQQYMDAFIALDLQNYTVQTGAILDWVGSGLYGIERTSLSSARYKSVGQFNTSAFNTIPFNYGHRNVTTASTYIIDDDLYKRILTWHYYKGDGKNFNIRWLKRRIMRFLAGTNGVSPRIDNTYQISVSFDEVDYRIVNITVYQSVPNLFVSGSIYGSEVTYGASMYGESATTRTPSTTFSYVNEFKAAFEGGVLELPFGYTFNVTIAS